MRFKNIRSKKGLFLIETLIRVIIAVVLVIFVFAFGSKLYAAIIGGQGVKSFYGLVDTIEELSQTTAGADAYTLTMDESKDDLGGPVIVGFNKDSDTTFIVTYYPNAIKPALPCGEIYFFIKPENQCEKDKPCLCLFQKISIATYDQQKPILDSLSIQNYFEDWCPSWRQSLFYTPEKSICTDINQDINFKGAVLGLTAKPNTDLTSKSKGWAIWRKFGVDERPKTSAIYLEKYKNTIKVCGEKLDHCITDEEKTQIDLEIQAENEKQVIEDFKNFKKAYDDCVKEEKCSTLTLELRVPAYLLHNPDGSFGLYVLEYKEYLEVPNKEEYSSIKIPKCDTEQESKYYPNDKITVDRANNFCIKT